MEIIKKIAANNADGIKNPSVTIAFFGDSVTQGAFNGYFNYDAVYHNLLRRKLNILFPRAVISIINAAVAGTRANFGLERIERDVLSKNPDLCVVCFGLNDVAGCEEGIETYKSSLAGIFEALQKIGCEIIFMTPNMLNTTPEFCTEPQFADYAKDTAKWQNEGLYDRYIEEGKAVAEKFSVPVCDCYAKWKTMAEYGVETTKLLDNGINHPKEPMHELFAYSLLETLFK